MSAPSFEPLSLSDWRLWLEHNGTTAATGVWLIYPRKRKGGVPTFTASDAVDEALCWGWVDSLPRAVDETRSSLYFSRRKPTSGWSGVNKGKVEALLAQGGGRMAPPGLAAIAAAKANGSWERLDGATALVVPADLEAALAARPGARTAWDAFPPSSRRAILEWLANAKRPETRARRVEETAAKAAVGERANEWKRDSGGRGGAAAAEDDAGTAGARRRGEGPPEAGRKRGAEARGPADEPPAAAGRKRARSATRG
jgi:uncharacterized protein YdeI (YjbR/CyaY-like superfamily)